MTHYPSEKELSSKFGQVCSSKELAAALASNLGGKEVNCNMRVPQTIIVTLQRQCGASDSDADACSSIVKDILDHSSCKSKGGK